ncbi:hypothetical protein [Herbaspirillum autotrophicum]|uniref:hypothetical protein n=1 Tax=Herbaspirillum autotrophicum TaxID=180195 RepID=UPI0012EDF3B0|nr:hypothetical protein [Herbaspirillum autotrophicum]
MRTHIFAYQNIRCLKTFGDVQEQHYLGTVSQTKRRLHFLDQIQHRKPYQFRRISSLNRFAGMRRILLVSNACLIRPNLIFVHFSPQ